MDLDFDDHPLDHVAPPARAGARFIPKGRPQPKKRLVSLSASQTTFPADVTKVPASLDGSSAYPSKASSSETNVPESGTINQSTSGIFSEENADILSREFSLSTEPYLLRACTNMDFTGKGCEDGIETAPVFPYDPKTKDSAVLGDFITPVTDEDIHAQAERMQTGEGECHLDMETLDIVHEEGMNSAYACVDHITGKFQPKPRLLDNVIEEPESHFSGEWEHEEQAVSPSTTNTVEGVQTGREREMEKSKRTTERKRKNISEGETKKSSENPQKKKFKHSCRRQKRTLEKELVETPDDEIRFLPLRDVLRLVEHKEWMEKKEAKGTDVHVPPTQENSNMNQYHSQSFDAEDEFGMEDSENQETNVVKPDSPVNYQTYMNKTSRTRWSKQDTQLFYEGIQEFGSNLSMVQQLFPNRTREQIKLKFKLEERRYPLKLYDAFSSRSKHLTHFQNVIKKFQQEAAAAAAREGEEEEEEEETAEAETTTDVPEDEEPERVSNGVKESNGGDVENVMGSDGGDKYDEGDDDFWSSYKSDM